MAWLGASRCYRNFVGLAVWNIWRSSGGRTFCISGSRSGEKPDSDEFGQLINLDAFPPSLIRNFCIIAHVDHGKSTLADRLLEITGTIERSEKNAQVLDTLAVERERGITVKAQTASMVYKSVSDNRTYLLNLIDTPGHADFSYEVSRSLSASDGALLLVDVSQGVQAQTVANFWTAFEMDVSMIGILNKIDLADEKKIEDASFQMESLFDLESKHCLRVSAKTGAGVDGVLEAIVQRLPAPQSNNDAPLRALIFDSWFDQYRGCYLVVLVKDGHVKPGQVINAVNSGRQYEVQEVGMLRPSAVPVPVLYAGQVGYVTANIRHPRELQVGDTLCWAEKTNSPGECSTVQALPGFRQIKPMVFSGLFPVDPGDHEELKSALSKLALTDPSVTLSPDHSSALGAGWRCGFLGVLHMEVFNQRLEKEFGASTIMTAPSVPYRAKIKDSAGVRRRYGGQAEIVFADPSKFPDPPTDVEAYFEPLAQCTAIVPLDYCSIVRPLISGRRGLIENESMIDDERLLLKFQLPLAEVVVNFVGALKQATSGYGSFDYELSDYQQADLVKVRLLVNDRPIDEFSQIVLRDQARLRGSEACQKLKASIPRQQFEVVIQAAINNKVVAKAVVKPIKKDFSAKLKNNFGDHTRLRKLLEYQREGKQRMKLLGNVEIPKEAFLSVLSS